VKEKKRKLSLGLDVSTQGITAVALDIGNCTKSCELTLDYMKDPRLNIFGLRREDYILPPETEGEASQPPELFFTALDTIFGDLKNTIDLGDIVTVNTSGQQHGHVYLNYQAQDILRQLLTGSSAGTDLVTILKGSLAYHRAPIWMTSDTIEQAEFIRNHVGGKERLIKLSGSNAPLRFTGIVMRKIAWQFPEVYRRTENIQLISSLVPAVLTGNARAPIDCGNACGMSLMDYRKKSWSDVLIKAVSEGLPGGDQTFRNKLPALVVPDAMVGTIAKYFVEKYGFSPSCQIIAGSGDNPQSKVLVTGDLLSLGSSIVNMVATDGKTFDKNGFANAMYDGVGRPFMFGCRTNGAMVWDRLRAMYGLEKEEYRPAEEALRQTPVAQGMVFWQPRSESFPPSESIDMVRLGSEKPGLSTDYAGIIETTLAAVYHHSKSFTKDTRETLYVTGGARKSREILRRVAAIWNRPVTAVEVGGAALGASVVGAASFLISQGNVIDTEKYISSVLLVKEPPCQPGTEDTLAFHRPGGFLDRFAATEMRLLRIT
jgi:xylulokinase